MRGACIDIGSNTTRLLVADLGGGALTEVEQRRAFTHLRRAVGADGRLGAATIDDVVTVVVEQLALARELGAEHIEIVATAAVRRALNAADLSAAIQRHCGLALQVLPERDEARLAFRGACGALVQARRQAGAREPWSGALGVADVGGGSSELVVGRPPDEIAWFTSSELGSGRLADAFLHGDPPSAAELDEVRSAIARELDGIDVPRPQLAVAVGGSAASLRRLAGDHLDGPAFAAALERLMEEPAGRVAERFELDAERVRLLPAGLLILEAVHERFGVPLELVGGGLREGVLLELAHG